MSKPKEIFLPSLDREIGAVHPINQVKFELVKLLTSFGFEVAEGPEIESCLLYTSPSPRDSR